MTYPFKIARSLLYLSALYVVFVTSSTLFPFIVGKYAWFRGTVGLALIAFAFGLLFFDESGAMWERLKEVFRKPLVIALAVFTFVFLLAGFFGVDPAFSFWSNFERGEGGLQMLHLFVLVVLLVTLLREERDWSHFFMWVLAGGVLSIGYGFFAAWDVSGFVGARFAEPGFRFQASIGNPAYVAAFSIFMAFYAGYLLWSRYRARLFSAGAWALYGLLALMAVAFVLAATRGAFIGLIVGLIAGCAYFVFAHRAWRRWFAVGAVALVLLVSVFVFFKDTDLVKAIPGSRVFDISLSAETFRHRAIMWGIALEGWKERPLLGWGAENYIQIFDQKLDPAYFDPAVGFGAWFDRAHSIYFDYLAETGIVGLLSFLALFAVFAFGLFKKREGAEGKESIIPKALLTGAIAAYLVQGIVLFDVLPIFYNLFVVLAFASYYFSIHSTGSTASKTNLLVKSVASALTVILAVGALVYGVYAPVAKASQYITALQTISSVNSIEGFKAHFNPALTHWSPIGQEEVVKYLGSDIVNFVVSGDQSEEAARALVEYIEPYLFPNNVRHLLMGGHLYSGLWEQYGKKSEDYVRAEEYYTAAFRIGPGLPPVLYSLFDLALKAGETEKANAAAAEILRLWPEAEAIKEMALSR